MKKYDVIVTGAGFAGVSAAIAAARSGLKVLIADKGNCLGGTCTQGLVTPFMSTTTVIDGKKVSFAYGIFREIVAELVKYEEKNLIERYGEEKVSKFEDIYTSDYLIDDEYLKFLLNRMMQENGIDVLFHSFLSGAGVNGSKIEFLTFTTKSGSVEISADYFIDASGDADLAYLAGCPYEVGRAGDGLCQPMSLGFRVGNVDVKKFTENVTGSELNVKFNELREKGEITIPNNSVQIFKNCAKDTVHFNSTRVIKCNPLDVFELSKAETTARAQVYELHEFMKKHIAGFENSRVIKTATAIGIRESRRIVGEHILTGEELVACTKFDDAICAANYDIDIHNPDGAGVSHHYFKAGEYYTVPYRSLVPMGIDNLAVAGRCISTTHEAQASIRIIPIVSCLGEAAGTAVGIASKSGIAMRDVDISALQDKLLKSGAILK
ncbi:MAG: FAD-dependent oxidoreductase [Clostridia bacterium]|nr:FAD-dependent oxidoreductase [Clostridia bacterium]